MTINDDINAPVLGKASGIGVSETSAFASETTDSIFSVISSSIPDKRTNKKEVVETLNKSEDCDVRDPVRDADSVRVGIPDNPTDEPYAALKDDVARTEQSTLARFNKYYALTELGLTTRTPVVAEFNERGDLVCTRSIRDFKTWASIVGGSMIKRLQIAGGKAKITYEDPAQWWIKSPKHRWYKRIELIPPGHPDEATEDRVYNLWRGFAVTPQSGDWSRNKAHLFDVICNKDETLFQWLMNWLAALVQKPGQHGMIAPLLVGGQGAGKGHFVEQMLMHLFEASQSVHLGKSQELTGDFNGHISGKLLVYADEAFWGSRATAEGIKRMISADTLLVNQKYQPVRQEQSLLHLILASNNPRPLHMDLDDRRFAVFAVSGEHRQDQDYFRALREELTHGGRGAMLAELLKLNVVDYDLRNPPVNEAKAAMKEASLNPFQEFWMEQLTSDSWKQTVVKSVLHDALGAWWIKHNRRDAMHTSITLGRLLHSLFKAGGADGYPKDDKTKGPERQNAYTFPSLRECREVFEKATGVKPDWENESYNNERVEPITVDINV